MLLYFCIILVIIILFPLLFFVLKILQRYKAVVFIIAFVANIALLNIAIEKNGVYKSIFCIFLFCTASVLASRIIIKLKWFRIAIVARILTTILFVVTILFLLYITYKVHIGFFGYKMFFPKYWPVFYSTKIGWILTLAKIDEFLLIYIFEVIIANVYYLKREITSKTMLYLRNFRFDNCVKDDSCLNALSKISQKHNLILLKIGNPNEIFPTMINNGCKQYFLTTTNWQEEVDKLIGNSHVVFSVIDISEGILWEIYEHLNVCEKFIYHISNARESRKLFSKTEGRRLYDKSYNFTAAVYSSCNTAISMNSNEITFFVRDTFYYCSTNLNEVLNSFFDVDYSKLQRIHI